MMVKVIVSNLYELHWNLLTSSALSKVDPLLWEAVMGPLNVRNFAPWVL